jgi:hypothetical protein
MMGKREPAEFPGHLTGEVILHSDLYELNEKVARRGREQAGRSQHRSPRWRRILAHPWKNAGTER